MTPDRYAVSVRPLTPDEGTGFLASVPDLPGCQSDGATPEAAQANLEDAIRQWVVQAQALGRRVPWPRPRLIKSHSGAP